MNKIPKETGIIMSGNHPRLILGGIKTMTRRTYGLEKINKNPDEWVQPYQLTADPQLWTWRSTKTGEVITIKCPFQVGDKLWVRETWRLVGRSEDRSGCCRLTVEYKCDGVRKTFEVPRIIFNKYTHKTGWGIDSKWRPSIFIPRWASRILLEITEVRAERLQEISYWDAKAEGILRFDREHPEVNGGMGYNRGYSGAPMRYDSTAAFMDLWDSLNGKKYPWSANNWVWVISFKEIPGS